MWARGYYLLGMCDVHVGVVLYGVHVLHVSVETCGCAYVWCVLCGLCGSVQYI